MIKLFRISTTIVVIFFLLITSKGEAAHMNSSDGNGKANVYFFEMDKKTQDDFLKKVSRIKIGDSIAKVKVILGEPTYDEVGMSKKGVFRFRVLDYYIKEFRKNLVNEQYDKLVSFYFDDKDQLVKIISNIESFKGSEIGVTH